MSYKASTSPSDKEGDKQQPVLEPAARMKLLIETSHDIVVDKNIAISKYFHSGREIIKAASTAEQVGDIEKAFVLYLRYMTLFIEKIIHHPEYKQADKAEKAHVKSECNRVFDLAENLKKQILDKFQKEYDEAIKDKTTVIKDDF